MKEVLIREYEILISAPSDVYSFVDTVKQAIADYNNDQGVTDHIRFIQKNWKEHAVPMYGKAGQSIINDQLTNNAEVVIALFGAKFGEPTEKYSSGTLEEIETVFQNGGRILTYFLTGKMDLSSIDLEQLKRVNEFKKNYNGLYDVFSDADELRRKIVSALGRTALELKNVNGNDLRLYSVKDYELRGSLVFEQHDFLNSKNMLTRKAEIINLINTINSIVLERPTPRVNDTDYSSLLPEGLISSIKNITTIASIADPYPVKAVVFSEDFSSLVNLFASENGLELSDDFSYVRNGGYIDKGYLGECSLAGDDLEKKKLSLLIDLESKIKQYYHLIEFLDIYQKTFFITLAIKNESNIFADDISIKLYFDSDSYIDPFSLSVKEQDIGEFVKGFPSCFEYKDCVDIDDMVHENVKYPSFIPYIHPLTGSKSEPDLDYYQEYFRSCLEEVYPFTVNKQGKRVVIRIDLPHGVKQFASQFLSASLLFKKPVEKIEYIITSKSFGHQMKGELLQEQS